MARLPTIQSTDEIDDSTLEVRLDRELSDGNVAEIRKVTEREAQGGNRGLKAIKEIQVSRSWAGSTVMVKIHPIKVPKLTLVKGEHTVACHVGAVTLRGNLTYAEKKKRV